MSLATMTTPQGVGAADSPSASAWISLASAARILGVDPGRVQRAALCGRIRTRPAVGSRTLYNADDVRALADGHDTSAA